jgi:hypothetical protein
MMAIVEVLGQLTVSRCEHSLSEIQPARIELYSVAKSFRALPSVEHGFLVELDAAPWLLSSNQPLGRSNNTVYRLGSFGSKAAATSNTIKLNTDVAAATAEPPSELN